MTRPFLCFFSSTRRLVRSCCVCFFSFSGSSSACFARHAPAVFLYKYCILPRFARFEIFPPPPSHRTKGFSSTSATSVSLHNDQAPHGFTDYFSPLPTHSFAVFHSRDGGDVPRGSREAPCRPRNADGVFSSSPAFRAQTSFPPETCKGH